MSSDGFLYGCLSNASRHRISDLLDLPQYLALPKLQGLLVNALGDKKIKNNGEYTVIKNIGGELAFPIATDKSAAFASLSPIIAVV